MNGVLDFVAGLGRTVLDIVRTAGRVALFAAVALSHMVRPPFYWRTLWTTLVEIGFFSLPVVALTALFSGGVIALQSYTGFAQYHAQNAIAGIVILAVTRELGPVLAGLMVAGRVGAAMSARSGPCASPTRSTR